MDTILTIVKLLGGLGLFIYGMKLMGDGLENAAGEGLKKILEKVTKNPIIGSYCRSCSNYGNSK